MTGFRVSSGGAQELYNVMPDITTLGKIIGGGLPVGDHTNKFMANLKEIRNRISSVTSTMKITSEKLAHTQFALQTKMVVSKNYH